MNIASIALPRIFRIGGGASKQLPEVLASLGLSRPLIVTDAYLMSSGRVAELENGLAAAGIAARVFADTVPDPRRRRVRQRTIRACRMPRRWRCSMRRSGRVRIRARSAAGRCLDRIAQMLGQRKIEPHVPLFRPYRLFGHRKVAVGKGARRNPDQVREPVGFPPERRPAVGAEMEGHVAAAGRRALESLGARDGQCHTLAGKKGRDAEERSGSPLAIEAMAERHLRGLAGAGEDELAAMTGGGAFHKRRHITARLASKLRPITGNSRFVH